VRIGIIASSGGSVFIELNKILRAYSNTGYEFFVVTDRDCGIEEYCEENKINYRRIEDKDNAAFSLKAKNYFDSFDGVDFVLLFFSRLVTRELFRHYPTFNIHPSLLPAFRGFSPVQQAIRDRVKFFGATLHLVSDGVDNGPIIAQTCMPVSADDTEDMLNKFSFIQKVYLSLLVVDLLEAEALRLTGDNSDFSITKNLSYSDRCNFLIGNRYFLESINRLQEREKVDVIS
jgi:phosphoribosylglycinamide formyltransferase-1